MSSYLRDQQQATVASPLWNWKRICYFQAVMLVCDLLLIPLLPFLIVGPWRIKDLWTEQFAPPPSSRVKYWKSYSMVYGEMRTAVLHTAGEVILGMVILYLFL